MLGSLSLHFDGEDRSLAGFGCLQLDDHLPSGFVSRLLGMKVLRHYSSGFTVLEKTSSYL